MICIDINLTSGLNIHSKVDMWVYWRSSKDISEWENLTWNIEMVLTYKCKNWGGQIHDLSHGQRYVTYVWVSYEKEIYMFATDGRTWIIVCKDAFKDKS